MMFRAAAWLRHQFRATGPRSVHSPWLYQLYQALRKPDALKDSKITKIAFLHGQLRADHSPLIFNEIGSREGRIKSTVCRVYKRTASSVRNAEMIAELASHFNGKTILEMGTAFGTTTLAMHFAARKSRIITLEGVPEIAAIAQENFNQYEAAHVALKIGRFADTLPQVIPDEKELALVFIDGHHSRKPTMEYLEMIVPALAERAVVVLDDIYYSRDMKQCWSELQQHPVFQVKMDFFRFGLLIKNADLSRESFRLRL